MIIFCNYFGFLLLALAINTEQSIDSFLFYLIQYTITNLNIFLIILALTYIIYAPTHENSSNGSATQTESNSALQLQVAQSLDLIYTKIGNIRDIRYISELKGLFFSNPLLSLSLGICLFSMAGKI